MKLLLVEDEIKIAKSLQIGLHNAGYVVDVAHDGQVGLNKARSEDYDLIILDLMLPSLSGIEILSTLRRDQNDTPVIILTAKDAIDDKVKGLDLGADDYLAKPFSIAELMARIRAQIRRNNSHEVELTVDDLIVDERSKQAFRKNKELSLSAKELSILIYLLRHKGQYISADQLLSHVWQNEYDVSSNVIAAHMKNLRKKLQVTKTSKELIESARGLGYRIK